MARTTRSPGIGSRDASPAVVSLLNQLKSSGLDGVPSRRELVDLGLAQVRSAGGAKLPDLWGYRHHRSHARRVYGHR